MVRRTLPAVTGDHFSGPSVVFPSLCQPVDRGSHARRDADLERDQRRQPEREHCAHSRTRPADPGKRGQPFRRTGLFTPVGDENGLLIVVKRGRLWFPEARIAATDAPLMVRISDQNATHYRIVGPPYRLTLA